MPAGSMTAINLTVDTCQSRATVAPVGRKKRFGKKRCKSRHFPTAKSSACIAVLVF
jgi:hypothetical protein